jgi:hypothetical protein
MSGNQLTRKTQWMSKRQREDAIADLLQAKRLLGRDHKTGTNVAKMYRKPVRIHQTDSNSSMTDSAAGHESLKSVKNLS